MSRHFLQRQECYDIIKKACEGNHWATAFILGYALQGIELSELNEITEAALAYVGDTREETEPTL